MRSRTETLSRMLISSGIQPKSFAYFLIEFENRKPKKRQSERSRLLTNELKAQAELIRYHLEN